MDGCHGIESHQREEQLPKASKWRQWTLVRHPVLLSVLEKCGKTTKAAFEISLDGGEQEPREAKFTYKSARVALK